MNGDQIANLIYLVLLGAVIAGWLVLQSRQGLNRTLQYLAVWALIFIGVVAAAGLWGDIRQRAVLGAEIDAEAGEVRVPRSPDGHYYVTLEVNGTPTRFVVDTGATDIVLTQADARAAGVDPGAEGYWSQARTANGTVRVAPVTLDQVALGPFRDRGVSATVNEGEMETSLLGMRYLQRYARLEIAGGELVLAR